jgi:tripartite-type tricarboxylate transporter receptor subunit TctC
MSSLRPRQILVIGFLALAQQGLVAQAQVYPTRPITLISPWPPGGVNDTTSRVLGAELAKRLGQPVVIENRAGAGSTLGVGAVARATPDGCTLVTAGLSSLATSVTIYKKLSYDPTKDFAPVALIMRVPFVLVAHPSLPARSASELIEFAKQNPDQLVYASGGTGSPHHLFTELFKNMTGVTMRHVPYKGTAPALTDMLGGHVPIMFSDPVPVLPLIREGKLRALGVSTKARWAPAPDIPPLTEAGVAGFDVAGWVMIVAPARTPRPIVDRLHGELKSIAASPEGQKQMQEFGMVPVDSPPPEELQPFINSEIERWSKVVRQAGIAGSE